MAEVPEPDVPGQRSRTTPSGACSCTPAGRGAARKCAPATTAAARAGAARARGPLVRGDRRARRHEGERGRAAHLSRPREPAHGAPAGAGRPREPARGVPALPATPRGPSRRAAQRRQARRDPRAPRGLRALPGRPRGHARGVEALPDALPAVRGGRGARAADERLEATGYWQQTAAYWRARRLRRGAALLPARWCSVSAAQRSAWRWRAAMFRRRPPHRPDDRDRGDARRRPRNRRRPSRRGRPRGHRDGEPRRPNPSRPPADPKMPPTSPVTHRRASRRSRRSRSPRRSQFPLRTRSRRVPAKPPAPPDTKAPIVTITTGPGAATATDAAQIGFKANEAGVMFSCSFDGAAFAACSSPVALTALSPASTVRGAWHRQGRQRRGAGVRRLDYTPPDTMPPSPDLVAARPPPPPRPRELLVHLERGGFDLRCSLDGGAFAACTSPAAYTRSARRAQLRGARHGRRRQRRPDGPPVGPWQPLPDLQFTAFSSNHRAQPGHGAGRRVGPHHHARRHVPGAGPPARPLDHVPWSTCRRGTYSAIVDRTNVVAESDETNNTATRRSTC